MSSTGKRGATKLDLLGACFNSSRKYYLWEEIGCIIKNFQWKVITRVFNVFCNMFPILPHFVPYVLASIILLVDSNIPGPILRIVGQG